MTFADRLYDTIKEEAFECATNDSGNIDKACFDAKISELTDTRLNEMHDEIGILKKMLISKVLNVNDGNLFVFRSKSTLSIEAIERLKSTFNKYLKREFEDMNCKMIVLENGDDMEIIDSKF